MILNIQLFDQLDRVVGSHEQIPFTKSGTKVEVGRTFSVGPSTAETSAVNALG